MCFLLSVVAWAREHLASEQAKKLVQATCRTLPSDEVARLEASVKRKILASELMARTTGIARESKLLMEATAQAVTLIFVFKMLGKSGDHFEFMNFRRRWQWVCWFEFESPRLRGLNC